MMLLVRTDMSGTTIDTPRNISRESIPMPGSTFYCTNEQRIYQHVVNHSYSADDSRPLFKGMIHAIYTIQD